MYNLSVRIKQKRNEKGIKQDELAVLLGKSGKQVISNWESGRAEPSIGDLYKIAEILDTTPTFLLSGDLSNNPQSDTLIYSNIAYWGNVDVTGGRVELENNSDNRPTGYIQIPGFEDCQHAVNHYGDSMSPYINGGDVIILKELGNWFEYIPYGETFLVITNNHRTVKYVRKSENPDNLLLVPHNSKYDAFEIPKKEILQMFLVKGSVQRKFL